MHKEAIVPVIHKQGHGIQHRKACRAGHNRKNVSGLRIAALLIIALLACLSLNSCSSGGGKAEAQVVESPLQDKQIETFVIEPASFFLQTDAVPTFEVNDSATIYTMQADGELTFMPIGAAIRTLSLEADDIVIERPGAGIITVIRDEQ